MSGPDFSFFLSSRSISKRPLDSPHMGIAQVFQTQNQCDWIKSISLPKPVLAQCTTTYGKEQGIFLESFLPQIPNLPRSTSCHEYTIKIPFESSPFLPYFQSLALFRIILSFLYYCKRLLIGVHLVRQELQSRPEARMQIPVYSHSQNPFEPSS